MRIFSVEMGLRRAAWIAGRSPLYSELIARPIRPRQSSNRSAMACVEGGSRAGLERWLRYSTRRILIARWPFTDTK